MLHVTIGGKELAFQTQPGLFSPDAADAGTLAMLSMIRFEPDDKVLDLGCGYGLVGVLAARSLPPEQVYLLDNDPVAVETARENLALNGVSSAQVMLSDGFQNCSVAGFSKIISNPPYHVDFAVPKHFIEKGFNRLAIGGALWMVTKRRGWYENKLRAIFGGSRVHELGGYFVFEAVKRGPDYAAGKTRRR